MIYSIGKWHIDRNLSIWHRCRYTRETAAHKALAKKPDLLARDCQPATKDTQTFSCWNCGVFMEPHIRDKFIATLRLLAPPELKEAMYAYTDFDNIDYLTEPYYHPK